LVLPEPQISDQELQQVVKLGRASELAKEIASESGIQTTDALLADYSITPQIAATPRTPAPITDRIMQEAQNVMALTHVETPLKGGQNTPLTSTDFSGALPQNITITTPNTVIATPFRTLKEVGGSTPSSNFATPSSQALMPVSGGTIKINNFTPANVRDKLNINPEDSLSVTETPAAYKHFQRQVKSSLREGLASLPAPKNDYEIVVPDEEQEEMTENTEMSIEDQADVDEKRIIDEKERQRQALLLRSQVIQRDLPRPIEINTTMLRPTSEMQGLTDLQKAEELIKQEMITMLHYDALNDPVLGTSVAPQKKLQHLNYLDSHPYHKVSVEERENASMLLKSEMHIVKNGMAHGDLSLESYSQVWQECLSQVLYLPSQNRYTRASLASKKDRIESYEKRLEQNRRVMAREAKKCSKLEKKLKTLLGGYQARAHSLIKQLQEIYEQIEQNYLSLSTFKFLEKMETTAIPKRLEVLIVNLFLIIYCHILFVF